MQSKLLQDTVCLPAGTACRSMAKIGNGVLLMSLNPDPEENRSHKPLRASAVPLAGGWPLGNLHKLFAPSAKLESSDVHSPMVAQSLCILINIKGQSK